MSQPPVSGHGLGEEPAAPDSGLPCGTPGVPGPRPAPAPDLRLGDFAKGGAGDTCRPGPGLAVAVAGLYGPDWRCTGAPDVELVGLLGRWAALESWAAAGKLGVTRELIRRRGFTVQRTLTRMFLGNNAHPGNPELVFGISSPEKG